MTRLYLSDAACASTLRPLSLTTHVSDLRLGITTIKEKWQYLLGNDSDVSSNPRDVKDRITIPANIIPTVHDFRQIIDTYTKENVPTAKTSFLHFNYPWELFQLNDHFIRSDFFSIPINQSPIEILHSQLIAPEQIIIEAGAQISHAVLNASTGPIYIGKNAVVMEGATIRGPFVLCEGAVVKMGARIYGATTIGKHSVVGGEIKNSIIGDWSAKAHDGYLGDSVIGHWCNLGAGTTCSNMKNNAGEVSVTLTADMAPQIAGIKCGLIMGDYSKTAINISLNTGTTVGVCCNIFGNENPPKYTNHFTWGSTVYDFEKAIRDISRWMELKHIAISKDQIEQLKNIFQHLQTST
jgi:UDP-N-acetylglucosamine diphosphorylase/glucosamine-1-phosphate N-acetyltransferase